jgi:hypothetical protein
MRIVRFLTLRVLYRIYWWSSSLRFWAIRRFTPAGLAVVAGLWLSAVLGTDMDQTMVYEAFTLLLAWLAVAFCGSWFFRARFAGQRRLPRYGTVGQLLHYTISLNNHTAKVQVGLSVREKLADPRPSFAEFAALIEAQELQSRSFTLSRTSSRLRFQPALIKEATLPAVPAGQQVEVQAELMPFQRGVLRFCAITVARRDPLGLVNGLLDVALPQSVLILPKRYPLPDLAMPGTSEYQQGGVALASSVGESEEFVSLRDYRPGDPLRHIHWRSWARMGHPIVKEFEDEFFVRHALILDTFSNYSTNPVFEEAVSVAASFACTIPTQESLLDLLFVGLQAFCFTAGRGLAHTDQMLEILASVRVCREKTFDELEHLVLAHVGAVSGCICVLLAWDERRQHLVQKLVHLGLPLRVIVITETDDVQLDLGPMKEHPGSFHKLVTGRIEEGLMRL